jgi:hypothetical protein
MLTGTPIVNVALLETIDRDGRRYICLAWYQGGGDGDSPASESLFSSDRDLNVCPSLDADHQSWTTHGQSLSLRGGCAPRSAVDALRNVDIHLRLRGLGFRKARVKERVGRDSARLSFSPCLALVSYMKVSMVECRIVSFLNPRNVNYDKDKQKEFTFDEGIESCTQVSQL